MSRDFLADDGSNVWGDIRLSELDEAGVPWEYLSADVPVLTAELIDGYDAIIFTGPGVGPETFSPSSAHPPLLLARFGVGYDTVDLPACTESGAIVTITPDGARGAVATAALTMLLAVSTRIVVKDGLARASRWDERTSWMGRGLTSKTIGLIGLGMSATALVSLLEPFHVEILAADPFRTPEEAGRLGVRLVALETLMRQSDAVVVMATYSAATHHLVGREQIDSMKAGSILVNVSRGLIVDESALIDALRRGHLYGAGLDVFEQEPPAPDSPLLSMPEVVLTPHNLAWTDEMSHGNGSSAVGAILDVKDGRVPRFVVNRDVLDDPRVRQRLSARGMENTR